MSVVLAIIGFFLIPSAITAFFVGIPISGTGQLLIAFAFMPIFALVLSDRKQAMIARIICFIAGFILLGWDRSPLPSVQTINNPVPIFISSILGWILFATLYVQLYKKKHP